MHIPFISKHSLLSSIKLSNFLRDLFPASIGQKPFKRGIKNIRAIGTKGYAIDTVPAEIRKAMKILIDCDIENPDAVRYNRYNYEKEKISNYEFQQFENSTGVAEADRILKRYTKRKIKI